MERQHNLLEWLSRLEEYVPPWSGEILMPVGRPPIYTDPNEMYEKGVEYIDNCYQGKEIPTTAGLALSLGFCDRHSLYAYKQKPEFSHTIKSLISAIEIVHEKRLNENGCAGSIFWLKNHDWTDRQDMALSTPHGPIQTDSKIEIILRKPNES